MTAALTQPKRYREIAIFIIALKLALIGVIVYQLLTGRINPEPITFDKSLLLIVFAGFVAQIIDGALGMAYGVSCSSMLLSFGVSPAVASASVHTAEVFTTGVSGLSHIMLRNVNKKLFTRLLIGGLPGAVLGAYLLAEVIDGKAIKPIIAIYLAALGIRILYKSFRDIEVKNAEKYAPVLGLVGAFLDSIGGGGWGPVVTSSLISQGGAPKETIGTVNTVEFFVSFASTGVFLYFVGIESFPTVVALVLGGLIAAPLGAFVVTKMSQRTALRLVGTLIIITSAYAVYKAWF